MSLLIWRRVIGLRVMFLGESGELSFRTRNSGPGDAQLFRPGCGLALRGAQRIEIRQTCLCAFRQLNAMRHAPL
jgi:hypothetical protein